MHLIIPEHTDMNGPVLGTKEDAVSYGKLSLTKILTPGMYSDNNAKCNVIIDRKSVV